MGSPQIGEELDLMGVKHCGIGPDPEHVHFDKPELIANINLDPEVEAVLVAMDEHLTFNKISKALTYLADPNCLYLTTNENEISVRVGRRILPLTYPFVAAVSAGSHRQPTIIGKPSTHLMTCIKSAHPYIDLSRTLMIGDSIHGDMAFARNVGIDCMMVLSGMSTESDIDKLEGSERRLCPDYVTSSVADIGSWLP